VSTLVTRSISRYNHDVTATLKVEPVVLEGKHVRLEPLTLAHAEDLARAAADGELWNSDVTIIPKPEGMKAYIEAALKGFALGFELPFAIVRKAGSATQVVGTTRYYEISSADRKAAIGYTWLSRSAQRTPVNTEAKLLLLTHAFETWSCVRVELITDVLNVQSRAAILRLGSTQEGILRKHLILPSGRVRDSVVFSIIDTEWPDVRARLISKLQSTSAI
jgi:RimJ/RimL family protein N-acetyltransferase